MMKHCSQFFDELIDRIAKAPPDDTREAEKLATNIAHLKERIGELEKREAPWGAAYWGIRDIARELWSIDRSVSPASNVWTVLSQLRLTIAECARLRIEVRELKRGTVVKYGDKI